MKTNLHDKTLETCSQQHFLVEWTTNVETTHIESGSVSSGLGKSNEKNNTAWRIVRQCWIATYNDKIKSASNKHWLFKSCRSKKKRKIVVLINHIDGCLLNQLVGSYTVDQVV